MEDLNPIIIPAQYVDNQPIETTPEPPTPFNPLRNTKMLIGFGGILLTLLVFLTYSRSAMDILSGGAFWVTHIAVIIFFSMTIFGRKAQTLTFPTRLNFAFIALVLFQIGCFTLNLDIRIFPPSTMWLQVLLMMSASSLIALTFRDLLPEKAMKTLYFLLGVSFIADLYFMATLLPALGVGFIGLIFFGLTIYVWGPLLKIIFITRFLIKNHDFAPKLTRFFGFGIGFSFTMGSIFLLLWTSMVNKAVPVVAETGNPLPTWVRVAQVLPPSVLTEKMMKSNQTGRFNGGFSAFETNNDREHDPLVTLANTLKPFPKLDETDRAKILRAIFDAKNDAEERLWTGDNLRLSTVETTIELHTPQRLAYTQQVLKIENTHIRKNAWNSEEAIMTFRLPEGGVVSSLSLWVNGVEREGLLTTKEKAAQAYRAIVGYENRDPSVIHWQEGNAVSLRVFPCTPTEMRQVKIGFTTPLEVVSNRLLYRMPTLEGLPMDKAKHTVLVTNTEGVESPFKFDKNGTKYSLSNTYDPNLFLSVPYTPLSESYFSFQNHTYRLHEMGAMETRYAPFEPSEIYLDINAAWSKDAETIWQLVKNKPVFAWFEGKITAVTESNRAAIFKKLADNNFSVFPFHEVRQPENALVISMNDKPFAPNFTDLKNSDFADEMAKKLPNMPQIRTFSIGSTHYLDALRQMRVTLSDKGDVTKLTKILTEKVFLKNLESSTELAIAPSNILISEEKGGGKIGGDAPDHVFRLFAYNKILASVGRNFYKPEPIENEENEADSIKKQTNSVKKEADFDLDAAVALAEKAHIVTPVSSLIVLETQADYDRFNINKSKNALGNASLNNAGAAPEPHEWLLILLAFGVIGWTIRQRFQG